MKIEDLTIDLQATISNLNIQYGNKPGYRGPSHHIYLEVWREEIELNIDQDFLTVWYHLGHKTIFYRLNYSHNSERIPFNVQTEGYGNSAPILGERTNSSGFSRPFNLEFHNTYSAALDNNLIPGMTTYDDYYDMMFP